MNTLYLYNVSRRLPIDFEIDEVSIDVFLFDKLSLINSVWYIFKINKYE